MTDRITNGQMEAELKQARIDSGLNLAISEWTPGDRYGTRYQLVIVDPSNGGENTISRVMNRAGMYDALRLLNSVQMYKHFKERDEAKEHEQ